MILREYQEQAVMAILSDIKQEGNSVAVLATGAGKSLILAEVARRLNYPILILQPSKEILLQNYDKLLQYIDPENIGIYSAGMNKKTTRRVTLATIGSIKNVPELFSNIKLVLIDECDLLNPRLENSMYTAFIKAIGNVKTIGVTGSPWRLSSKYEPVGGKWYQGCDTEIVTTTKFITRTGIWDKETRTTNIFWKRIIYNLPMNKLIEMGYLMKPTYFINSTIDHKDIPINKSASDFDLEKYVELISSREDAIMDVIRRAQDVSHSILVFCSSVEQAERLSSVVIGSAVVSAKTPKKEREKIIEKFKVGITQTVFNVGCLTVGFDSPKLDTIVLLRPTKSIRLYVQMLGRVVRITEGKTIARIIDFSGTIKSIGRIENIRAERVNGNWDIVTEKGTWHDRVLYKFQR